MKSQIALLGVLMLAACKPSTEYKEQSSTESIQTPTNLAANNSSKIYKTKSGKTIIVSEIPQDESSSISIITITPQNLKNNTPITISDADPLSEVFLADLDQDGFDELYIITKSTGSGSDGIAFAFNTNQDEKLVPITIIEPATDAKALIGYMGHDIYKIANGKLTRTFPIYNETDQNCCPTGGTRTISYTLAHQSKDWQLKISDVQ